MSGYVKKMASRNPSGSLGNNIALTTYDYGAFSDDGWLARATKISKAKERKVTEIPDYEEIARKRRREAARKANTGRASTVLTDHLGPTPSY